MDPFTAGQAGFLTEYPASTVALITRQNELYDTTVAELNLESGDSQLISASEWGDDVLDEVEIARSGGEDDGGTWVRGSVGVDWGQAVPAGEDPDEWLDEHQGELRAFLDDTYPGATLGDQEEWDDTTVDFYADVTDEDTIRTAGGKVADQAIGLHNALNGGYGVTPFGRAAKDWFEQREQDVQEASDSYGAAAIWTGTFDNAEGETVDLESEFDDSDLAEETKEQMRKDVAAFTLQERELIAQARHIAAQQGRTFDMSDVGHNFGVSRNGQRPGFRERDLGEVGDRLDEAAQAFGSFDLYPGDDGKLYAM